MKRGGRDAELRRCLDRLGRDALQVAGGTAAAYLVPPAAKEIVAERIPLVAGQGAPFGRADIVPGGYRLSGDYGYGSGALHSSCLHTGGVVYENGKARTAPNTRNLGARLFITRTADAELKENWDVLGLIATGSVDYVIKDVFVPEEFTHRQNAKRLPKAATSIAWHLRTEHQSQSPYWFRARRRTARARRDRGARGRTEAAFATELGYP
jgi:hypothetical protein